MRKDMHFIAFQTKKPKFKAKYTHNRIQPRIRHSVLNKYLLSQVGKPWSEVLQHIQHLGRRGEKGFLIKKDLLAKIANGLPQDEATFLIYVDPDTKKLKQVPKASRQRGISLIELIQQAKDVSPLKQRKGNTLLICIDGNWFSYELERVEEDSSKDSTKPLAYDVLFQSSIYPSSGRIFNINPMRRFFYEADGWYAKSYRQLSQEELQAHNFNSDVDKISLDRWHLLSRYSS